MKKNNEISDERFNLMMIVTIIVIQSILVLIDYFL